MALFGPAAAAAAACCLPPATGKLAPSLGRVLQAPIQAEVLSCSSTMLSVRLQEVGTEVGAPGACG